jgi:hypothetical protein
MARPLTGQRPSIISCGIFVTAGYIVQLFCGAKVSIRAFRKRNLKAWTRLPVDMSSSLTLGSETMDKIRVPKVQFMIFMVVLLV